MQNINEIIEIEPTIIWMKTTGRITMKNSSNFLKVTDTSHILMSKEILKIR